MRFYRHRENMRIIEITDFVIDARVVYIINIYSTYYFAVCIILFRTLYCYSHCVHSPTAYGPSSAAIVDNILLFVYDFTFLQAFFTRFRIHSTGSLNNYKNIRYYIKIEILLLLGTYT